MPSRHGRLQCPRVHEHCADWARRRVRCESHACWLDNDSQERQDMLGLSMEITAGTYCPCSTFIGTHTPDVQLATFGRWPLSPSNVTTTQQNYFWTPVWHSFPFPTWHLLLTVSAPVWSVWTIGGTNRSTQSRWKPSIANWRALFYVRMGAGYRSEWLVYLELCATCVIVLISPHYPDRFLWQSANHLCKTCTTKGMYLHHGRVWQSRDAEYLQKNTFPVASMIFYFFLTFSFLLSFQLDVLVPSGGCAVVIECSLFTYSILDQLLWGLERSTNCMQEHWS